MSSEQRLEEALGASANKDLDAELRRRRLCLRCGLGFRELTNIGTWACDSYHPAAYIATPHTQSYACCRRHVSDTGCVPTDHTDMFEFSDQPVPISDDMANAVREAQASCYNQTPASRSGKPVWFYDNDTRQWFVARVDTERLAHATSSFNGLKSYHSEHDKGYSAKELCL
jgi:hypothetical protein